MANRCRSSGGTFTLRHEFLAEFVDASQINRVNPPLIEEDEEDEVVAQTGEAVHEWHFDDESEEIINECVE